MGSLNGKVLITGGAGYIGSILTPFLLRQGYEVTVLDSFIFDQTSLLDCCHDQNFTLIKGEARDGHILSEAIKNMDWIIPLAALVGAPMCDKYSNSARSVNLDAIRMILNLKRSNQKIIFPNTNSGYGIGQDGAHCDENSPLNPLSLYAELKVKAEEEILKAGESITLRLATVFGISPRMRLDLLV